MHEVNRAGWLVWRADVDKQSSWGVWGASKDMTPGIRPYARCHYHAILLLSLPALSGRAKIASTTDQDDIDKELEKEIAASASTRRH